jgi:hypothetical protein
MQETLESLEAERKSVYRKLGEIGDFSEGRSKWETGGGVKL